jgi:ribosomal protein S18 acetylase RimI-like enzyme
MDDGQLKRVAWEGIVEFQRIIGTQAPEARLQEHEHYVASAVPTSPASLINAAVPKDQASLAPHLDELAEFYADVPKWGAWIDAANAEEADALRSKGLVLDSTPVLMAAALDDIAGLMDPPAAEPITPHEVGIVNDAAYGYAQPTLTRTLSAFPPDAPRSYGVRVDDEIASTVMIVDAGRDAFVTLVATLPSRRNRQLATGVLRHALADAAARGQTTTSLQASRQGQGIYARLGYRPLGEVHLYEKRPA